MKGRSCGIFGSTRIRVRKLASNEPSLISSVLYINEGKVLSQGLARTKLEYEALPYAKLIPFAKFTSSLNCVFLSIPPNLLLLRLLLMVLLAKSYINAVK
ncbi:hypothetical protein DL93DRAFT_1096742 [Clavulina sp. PMI_390]|nr:hypothetical protein DL93DRAFT_1096742 [Clavulina sp. PMI_390]